MDTTILTLTEDWQQIGNGGEVFLEGIFDWCICATKPGPDNPYHTMVTDQLKLPEGAMPWVRRSKARQGISRLTYTIFE